MIEALKDRTYMVRHSPNCPKRFEVRLTGMALLASMSNGPHMKRSDAVGYGDTADEAAANALASLSRPVRVGKVCGYHDGCPPDGPVCHLCEDLQPARPERGDRA